MSPYDSPKFRKLKEKWYQKIKKKGFVDIENERQDLIDHQSVYDFSQRIGFKNLIMESIRDYYYWASDMIMEGKFESAIDRKIWVLHSLGRSSREIGASVKLDQSYVCRKIKKIREYLKMQSKDESQGPQNSSIE